MPRLNVLIVDDDEIDRELVRRCLNREDQSVNIFECNDLPEAIRTFDENTIDIALLDLGLPSSTGLATLHAFREAAPDIPVVLLSGLEDESIAVKAVEDGAEDFIKKDGLEQIWLSISLKNAIHRHRLKRTLEVANLDLKQFAYVASHDLQEPLRAIFGYARLLRKNAANKLDEREIVLFQNIEEGAERMQNLIDGLLQYSQSSRDFSEWTMTELNGCVESACKNLHVLIEETDAILEVGKLPTVLGSRTLLTQLFQNLIGNAVKYRGEQQPRVVIEATSSSGFITVSVQDNGIGIAENYHKQVFGIFKRLHRREEYAGTGIGLALCEKIVEGHGGSIYIEPTETSGTRFVFRLPKLQKSSLGLIPAT